MQDCDAKLLSPGLLALIQVVSLTAGCVVAAKLVQLAIDSVCRLLRSVDLARQRISLWATSIRGCGPSHRDQIERNLITSQLPLITEQTAQTVLAVAAARRAIYVLIGQGLVQTVRGLRDLRDPLTRI